jgi:hypothetical protein
MLNEWFHPTVFSNGSGGKRIVILAYFEYHDKNQDKTVMRHWFDKLKIILQPWAIENRCFLHLHRLDSLEAIQIGNIMKPHRVMDMEAFHDTITAGLTAIAIEENNNLET